MASKNCVWVLICYFLPLKMAMFEIIRPKQIKKFCTPRLALNIKDMSQYWSGIKGKCVLHNKN